MNKSLPILFLCLLLVPSMVRAADVSTTQSSEPPAPKPSAAVQVILDKADKAAEAGNRKNALILAEQGLWVALSAKDIAGEAETRTARAIQLDSLYRTDESIEEWRKTAELWKRLGDGPGQAEALAWAACLSWNKQASSRSELQEALAITEAETRRPAAAATALSGVAAQFRRESVLPQAEQCLKTSLTILRRLAPDSLNVAASLMDLGVLALDRDDLTAAEDYIRQALTIRGRLAPDSLKYAASLNSLGAVAHKQGDLKAAEDYYKRALATRERLAPESQYVASSLNNLGAVSVDQGDLAAAQDYLQRALAIKERLAPESLEVALGLENVGSLAGRRGDLAAAQDYLQRALVIKERLAPKSQYVASSLNNLGTVAFDRGDLAAADDYHKRALAIHERLASDSLRIAASVGGLGNTANARGDLAAADHYYRRALAIYERLAPDSPGVAACLNNLGTVAIVRSDLAAADGYFRRALATYERLAPDSLDVASSLGNLSNLAARRGDLSVAEDYCKRELVIYERLAPDSLDVAMSLSSLGTVASVRGDLVAAEDYYRRALAIRDRLAPDSLDVALSLLSLGLAAYNSGDLSSAQDYIGRALVIQERLAPESLDVAASLNNLGVVARDHADLAGAEAYCKRALVIQERLAPDSLDVAMSLDNLGSVTHDRGDDSNACAMAARALGIARRYEGALRGEGSVMGFNEQHSGYAANLVEYQVSAGDASEAFRTAEDGRARAMRELLGERQALSSGEGGKLWTQCRDVLAGLNIVEESLSKASTAQDLAERALAEAKHEKSDDKQIAKLQGELDARTTHATQLRVQHQKLRDEADALWEKARKASPRAFVEALDVDSGAKLLPEGTLYVCFSAGAENTNVFLLSRKAAAKQPLSVCSVKVEEKDIRDRIAEFRDLVDTKPSVSRSVPDAVRAKPPSNTPAGPAKTHYADAVEAGRALFGLLFPGKAGKAVLSARRVLISPDGPLWDLPFAALVVNTEGAPKYFGIEKPLTFTQSLAVFKQCRDDAQKRRLAKRPVALVVAPVFDKETKVVASSAGGERAYLLRDAKPPTPLPGTRKEAKDIAALYGSVALMQNQATEKNVRNRIGNADIIHLATHGYLHPVLPMSSGVLLSTTAVRPKDGDTSNDGALQAWEIMSQLKLKADTVVLSACETGRGKTVSAEGIVGMTRALQYAGARSVVASQWKVSDESTTKLMVAFHKNLRKGLAKDEALRLAMKLVQSSAGTSSPYYWAPFLLTGDPDGSGKRQ